MNTAADIELEQWSSNEKRMLRYILENDSMMFFRYFFALREGMKATLSWHHYVLVYALDLVLQGRVNRLIVNMPPGYTKTEIAVLSFIMKGLVINNRSRFIHTTYGNDLALENSSKIKDGITSDEFQELWPMKVRVDTKSKKRWFTQEGGGMMAAAAGGQILGFRAGRMEPGFTGGLICDDPIKPSDANSKVLRHKINDTFNSSQRSRLAVESNPIVVIQQRLDDMDLSGYLLRGGSGDTWYHLELPADITHLKDSYPKDQSHGIRLDVCEILQSIHNGKPLSCFQSQIY